MLTYWPVEQVKTENRFDVYLPYVSRKEGGRGLTNNEDSLDTSVSRIEDYIKGNKERLITATKTKKKMEEKQLYSHFKR